MSDAQWDGLLIPINMAFFFRSSLENRVVASIPALPVRWNRCSRSRPGEISQESHAALRQLKPDIEALLVNRVGHAHGLAQAEYYIAPMDECYRLVGVIRMQLERPVWRNGSVDGDWQVFLELRARAEVVNGVAACLN